MSVKMLLHEITLMEKRKSEPNELTLLADDIRERCKPYLKDNKKSIERKNFLCHSTSGLNDDEKISFEISLLKSRSPTDTPRRFHDAADEYFEKKFGVKFRSKSIFTTPNHGLSEYGDPFIVFPVGEYKVCFSPIVSDAYGELFGGSHATTTNIKNFSKKSKVIDELFRATEFGNFLLSWINALPATDFAGSPSVVKSEMTKFLIDVETNPSKFGSMANALSEMLETIFNEVIKHSKKTNIRKIYNSLKIDSSINVGTARFGESLAKALTTSSQFKSEFDKFAAFMSNKAKEKFVFTGFMDFIKYTTDVKRMFDNEEQEVMVSCEKVILVKEEYYDKLLPLIINDKDK